MTAEAQLANLAWTLVASLVLWASWHYLVSPTLEDALRQRVFELRREMFLFMADGGIGRRHPAYLRLRGFMNSVIRYAHVYSLTRVAVIAVANRGKHPSSKALDEAIASLPPDVASRMNGFRGETTRAMAVYMFGRSPLGWLLILVTVASEFLKHRLRGSSSLSPRFHVIEAARLSAEEETQLFESLDEDRRKSSPASASASA